MVAKAEETIKKLDDALTESSTVSGQIEECLRTTEETRNSVQEYMTKLNTLQSIHQYLRVLQYVETLRWLFSKWKYTKNLSSYSCSVQLQKQVANKDDEICATVFANLCEVLRTLLELPPTNLCKCLKEVVLHWHNLLKEKFAKWVLLWTSFPVLIWNIAGI